MTNPSPAVLVAREELARLYAAPSLDDGDLARLPVLAAALGVAVRVRRDWRCHLHNLVRRWRALMLALLLLALLLAPSVAEAQATVRCRRGTEPGFYRGGGRTVAVCYVYRGPRGVKVLP